MFDVAVRVGDDEGSARDAYGSSSAWRLWRVSLLVLVICE